MKTIYFALALGVFAQGYSSQQFPLKKIGRYVAYAAATGAGIYASYKILKWLRNRNENNAQDPYCWIENLKIEKNLRMQDFYSTVREKLKKDKMRDQKIPLKYFSLAVIPEMFKLLNINVNEMQPALTSNSIYFLKKSYPVVKINFDKKAGTHPGCILKITEEQEDKGTYFVKTERLKNCLAYMILERLGIGPKVHVFTSQFLPNSYCVASKDIAEDYNNNCTWMTLKKFQNQTRKKGISLDEQIKTVVENSDQVPDEVYNVLKKFMMIDVLARILNLKDLSEDNIMVAVSRHRSNPNTYHISDVKIVDFVVLNQEILDQNIMENYLKGTFNFTTAESETSPYFCPQIHENKTMLTLINISQDLKRLLLKQIMQDLNWKIDADILNQLNVPVPDKSVLENYIAVCQKNRDTLNHAI